MKIKLKKVKTQKTIYKNKKELRGEIDSYEYDLNLNLIEVLRYCEYNLKIVLKPIIKIINVMQCLSYKSPLNKLSEKEYFTLLFRNRFASKNYKKQVKYFCDVHFEDYQNVEIIRDYGEIASKLKIIHRELSKRLSEHKAYNFEEFLMQVINKKIKD